MVSKFSILVVIAILMAVWIFANPREEFGFSFFGLTTYGAVPIPYFDVKIYSDGALRLRENKEHFVSLNETQEIMNRSIQSLHSLPDALVIGTGYDGLVTADEAAVNDSFFPVYALKTPDALKKFNELKEQGKRVAAIIHSTC